MRLLLDHCLDWRLKKSFQSHFVRCASDMGWERFSNGALLSAAAREFDVVLTTDRNLKHQQNVSVLPLAVIVLIGKTNTLADMLRLVPAVETALLSIKPGSLVEVSSP